MEGRHYYYVHFQEKLEKTLLNLKPNFYFRALKKKMKTPNIKKRKANFYHIERILFHLILVFFFHSNLYSQKGLDSKKSEEFKKYSNLVNNTLKNVDENCEKLIEFAQTPTELSFAYFINGGNKYRKGEYLEAVRLLETSLNEGGRKSEMERYILGNLVMAYRRSGLIEQSNEAWKRMTVQINKSNDKFKEAEYYYQLSKIYDIDEDYCKASDARKKYLSLVPDSVQKKDPDYIFAVYAQTGFSQIKCGDFKDAEFNLRKAIETISNVNNKSGATLYEMYELCLGLLAVKQGNTIEAQRLFSEAYNRSRDKGSMALTKLILTERLESNIDLNEVKLQLFNEINEITKLETKTTQNLTKHEFVKTKQKISSLSGQTQMWIFVAIFTVLLFSVWFYIVSRKNKAIRQAYLKIVEQLNSESSPLNGTDDTKSKIIKNDDTEQKIVENLESFEKNHLYTTKGLTTAQMAVMLDTNTKYLSYILGEYRNSNFNDYINDLRIDFIIRELQKKPRLANYKIAVLSDMCGYSTHSQFGAIFKAKKGLSPSQFIKFLQDEQLVY